MKHLENGLDVRFDLISAEDKMLETYAEILQLRMPLKRDEKMEKLEMMKPKYGFHILKWIHDMMKTHFPEFMKKVTPSLPNLKVAFYLKTSTKLFTTFQNVLYDKYSAHNHDYFDHEHENFFCELTKIKIVEYVLSTTKFVEEDEEEAAGGCSTLQRNRKKTYRLNSFGINKLINLKVFDDAYPTHDGELEDEGKKGGQEETY